MDPVTQAAKAAVQAAPCSLRALARETGVSHVLLIKIRDGDVRATEEVAKALAAALDRWGQQCQDAADGLRRALKPRRRQ